MDQETLVEELRELVARIEKNDGPVILLLLAALDEAGIKDVWNLIVSSPAFDSDQWSAISKVTKLMRATLKEENWQTVQRITILRTDESLLKAIMRRLPQGPAGTIVQNLKVSGIEISEAIVVEAKKLAA